MLQCSRIDAFDMWALRKILRIPYTRHVTKVEVRATIRCRPLSHLVTDRCLRLFGHIARSSPQEDHHRAVAAGIWRLSLDWKRPLGRPSHAWLHAVEADLGRQNICLEEGSYYYWGVAIWRQVDRCVCVIRCAFWFRVSANGHLRNWKALFLTSIMLRNSVVPRISCSKMLKVWKHLLICRIFQHDTVAKIRSFTSLTTYSPYWPT